jgi:hypothetical protein
VSLNPGNVEFRINLPILLTKNIDYNLKINSNARIQ